VLIDIDNIYSYGGVMSNTLKNLECEYIHEEHDQTPWDDLPESWLCPACSVEKGWFETLSL